MQSLLTNSATKRIFPRSDMKEKVPFLSCWENSLTIVSNDSTILPNGAKEEIKTEMNGRS